MISNEGRRKKKTKKKKHYSQYSTASGTLLPKHCIIVNSHSYTKRYLTVQHTNTHTNVQFRCLETPRRSSPLCMCGLWFSILNHEEKPPCRPQTWCPHLSLDSKTTDTTKNTNRDSLRPIQESHHGLIQLLQCLSICEPLLNQLVTCLGTTEVTWNRPNRGRTGPLHTAPL